MARVARSHGLSAEGSTFEEWDAASRMFDLVISGQAWHWVDPVLGPRKAADLLRPGARFAAFWNLGEHEPVVRDAFDRVYADAGIDTSDSVALGTYRRGGGSTIGDLATSRRFEAAEARRYGWVQRYSRDDWLDQLPTHSDHRTLPPETLASVLHAVGEAIDALGGSLVVHYDTLLVTALRLP
jgi:SAM-dependent methyltransferase